MIMISSIFFFFFFLNSLFLCYSQSFLTKVLTLDVLLSTAVRAVVVVAKLVILYILFLISFVLALRAAIVAKLLMLGISFLT